MSGIAYKDVKALNSYVTKTGETKTKYTTIGVAFENNDGSVLIKLQALPLPTLFKGQLECTLRIDAPGEKAKFKESKPVPAVPFSDDEIPF
jgi:hypothetical protein